MFYLLNEIMNYIKSVETANLFFLTRDACSVKRGIAIVSRPSFRPSVRPSVCL